MNSLKTKVAVKRVEQIFMEYLKAKKNVELISSGYKFLLEDNNKNINEQTYVTQQQAIIDNIEKIFEILSLNAKKIIEFDFARKTNDYWWTQYYSRSTYYRHRAHAINEFLYFYEV